MSKVITFSRVYPSYHPRKGEPTNFVEKIWHSIGNSWFMSLEDKLPDLDLKGFGNYEPKFHTIRAGHRFKIGDWFSPRVWSGKPYNSKQIVIAPDIQVKKVWRFSVEYTDKHWLAFINGVSISWEVFAMVAKNDGLDADQLCDWFKIPGGAPFSGQIICWNETIEY